MSNAQKPLSGITVVELATFVAAPCATRAMADWGADVIKIEPPKGDPMRMMGGLVSMPTDDERENPAYDQQNSNKRGIVLNLKDAKGQEAMHRLLSRADVFVTNNRQDALERLGLSYEQLCARYPALVYGQVSGYGENGPDKDRPGFDFTAYYARGGISGTLHEKDGPPMMTVAAYGDQQVGMCLAAGLCAALVGAKRTGRGEKVSVSLYHTAVYCMGHMVASAQYGGNHYPRSRLDTANPLQAAYRTRDGRWLQGAINAYDVEYERFCRLIGRDDLAVDERFNAFAKVKNNPAPFIRELDKAFAEKDCDEWMAIFKEADLPFEKELLWEEILEDPQAWGDDVLCAVEGYPDTPGRGDKRTLVRSPVKFSGMGLPHFGKGPRIGEHTDRVLTELGYSQAEIAAMRETGSVK